MSQINQWYDSETDGCCKQPCASIRKLCWITPSAFSEAIQQQEDSNRPLVLDMRSYSTFNAKHISSARSLSFSPILVRRMLKGCITLDTLVTDPQLFSAIEAAKTVVLYDTNSKPGNIKEELMKFSELLVERFSASGTSLRILLGGMSDFEGKFPHLCTSQKALSPTRTTFDMSRIEKKERPGVPEGHPVEILPFLYLGSAKDSSNVESLRQMGITAILNITTNCPNLFESEFEYMSIQVEDSPQTDLLSRIHQAIQFIDNIKNNGGRVFVHCHAGISRSATVCIAYVMQTNRLTAHEAYTFVKSKRPIISPNLSFMGQLIQFEQSLKTLWSSSSSSSCTLEPMETSCINNTTKDRMISGKTVGLSMTRSTSPKQSIATAGTTGVNNTLMQHYDHFNLTDNHARESNMVSQLTDRLNNQPSYRMVPRPPRFSEMERSLSTPINTTASMISTCKRKREGLRLSLELHNPARRSPQLSPCRVEASLADCKISQSLNLSHTNNTTCT